MIRTQFPDGGASGGATGQLPAPAPAARPATPAAAAPGILLVNDDPGTLFALRTVLSDLDVPVATASSGEQALLRLLHDDIALIILDVKMAGMDGFEMARLVRARARTRATPIIFLTSHRATDLDRAAGYALGAADYLFMPVAPEILKAKVQALLDAGRAAPAANPSLPPRTGGAAPPAPHPGARHGGEYVALLDPGGAWLYAGASYQRHFGVPIQPGGSYLSFVHEADRDRLGAALAALAAGDSPRRLQYRVIDHEERFFETDLSLVRGADGRAAQLELVSRDITERKEMEAYVLHQSFHDALTGLPNRLLLADRLGQATAHRERLHARVAVLFIDLDRFKEVNDTLGHAAGDRLLQDVAERLSSCVRDGDTVARLGGDEFVVMLVGLHETGDAAVVADKIVAVVSGACRIDGSELHVAPSIGIAIFPDDGEQADALLRNADTAMYHAKREGGARFCFFTGQMQELASRKLAMVTALQRAIGAGEFRLHYQPKVHARSGAICGFEALIRWPQAGGGFISPADFIPVAEESGRIDPIGRWALAEAARERARWRALGVDGVPIAVNLSALQFRREQLADELAQLLQESGIEPSMLELELTETGIMSNPALAVQTLHRIHDLGIAIAIDDFGTGYSSLAYLKRLPIDKLKIDASFVHDIASNEGDAAIVLAIITLAHVLRLTVVAEGVETAEQARFLIEHGCDELQGNHFSAAVSGDEALALLRQAPFRGAAQQGDSA